MLKTYLKNDIHRAAKWFSAMSAVDAEALCFEFNSGRDPSRNAICFYNGSMLSILQPGQAPSPVPENNWIVAMPNGSFTIHADSDFCASFCPATK
jgi:hypothetical protein